MEHATYTDTQWPVVTRSLLADMERIAAAHEESQVNQGVLALVRARKAIHDAVLSLRAAERQYVNNSPVKDRLERVRWDMLKAHDTLPLTILDNGGGHPRPKIMK